MCRLTNLAYRRIACCNPTRCNKSRKRPVNTRPLLLCAVSFVIVRLLLRAAHLLCNLMCSILNLVASRTIGTRKESCDAVFCPAWLKMTCVQGQSPIWQFISESSLTMTTTVPHESRTWPSNLTRGLALNLTDNSHSSNIQLAPTYHALYVNQHGGIQGSRIGGVSSGYVGETA